MVITQTPYRISFFGGGTDYRPYFMEHGGSVLSTTIDKYCYLSVRKLPPFFEHRFSIKYSKVETKKRIQDIQHPSVRECLLYMGMEDISISHDGDLPARAGLGTSSSFTVGLLNALHALKGEYIDSLSLAKEAIHVEQDLIGEYVGVQDQLAVSVGGFNRIYFTEKGYEIQPVILSEEKKAELNGNLMLFFTGLVRFASDIAEEQVKNMGKKLQELHEMGQMVEEAECVLQAGGELKEFGRLLDETWKLKRGLTAKITTNEIDNLYERARKAGAIGGKLLGAGSGGFLLFYVEPDQQEAVRQELADLLEVPFQFETGGSKVIYFK